MKGKTEKKPQDKSIQNDKQDRQGKKFNISLPQLPKGLKIFLSLFAVVVFSAVVLFFSYHVSYRYWLQQMGDGAYKYSAKTYEMIEETISKCMPQESGPDIRGLEKFLDNPEDVENPTTIGKYVSTYENGQTTLTCSIQDGYFNAEVTVTLDKNFTILSNSRNFNSLEAYMAHYWDDLEQHVLISTLEIFAAVAGITFVFFGSVALICTKVKAKKEKEKSTAVTSSERNSGEGTVGSASTAVRQAS